MRRYGGEPKSLTYPNPLASWSNSGHWSVGMPDHACCRGDDWWRRKLLKWRPRTISVVWGWIKNAEDMGRLITNSGRPQANVLMIVVNLLYFAGDTGESLTSKCVSPRPVCSAAQTASYKWWRRKRVAKLARCHRMGCLVWTSSSARVPASTHRSLLLTMIIMYVICIYNYYKYYKL